VAEPARPESKAPWRRKSRRGKDEFMIRVN
jgi:hypothetical protein